MRSFCRKIFLRKVNERMAEYTVSASVVLYNGFDEAAGCIESVLEKTTGVPLALYLIDNASPDGSGEKLKERFAGRAEVICSPQNLGYGKGHNLCLEKLNSKYHAVINPDIVFGEDTLSRLCVWLDEHPDVVMVTPNILFPDGRVQRIAKRIPNVLALTARQLPLGFLKPYENHYLMLDRDLSQPQEIQFCTGCFFVIRTDVLKSFGGFDPDYFMYVEDADITRRAMRCGKVMYLPETYVYHRWHRAPTRRLKPFLMQLRSMLLYFGKWGFCFGFGKKAACLPCNADTPAQRPAE